jgi:asparaginyl-tRNA synthetase
VRVSGTWDPVAARLDADRIEVLAPAPAFPVAGATPSTTDDAAYRHLRVRHPRFAAMFRVRHAVLLAVHEFFAGQGFTFVTAPVLGGPMTACEDIGLSFRVEHPSAQVFLSQSARVYKEALVYSLGRVYLIQPSFRRESPSARHLQEFWHLEAEWLGATEDDLVAVEERLVVHLAARVRERCPAELEVLGGPRAAFDGLEPPFVRVEYEDAVRELGLADGAPISADGEAELLRRGGGRPVVLQHFPMAMKGFYARPCPGRPELSQTHDLLLPGVGEVFGGAVREDDPDRVRDLVHRPDYLGRLAEAGVGPETHEWYLDLRRYGAAPHGGFGTGVERMLRWLTGVPDVRDTVAFPRVEGRYDP